MVRAAAVATAVQISIVDRGGGVPDNAKEVIFAPCQRYGDTPKGTGVGLGLAVSRGLMESMNGTITAEDTPGGGLTIVLELPRAAAATHRSHRGAPAPTAAAEAAP